MSPLLNYVTAAERGGAPAVGHCCREAKPPPPPHRDGGGGGDLELCFWGNGRFFFCSRELSETGKELEVI